MRFTGYRARCGFTLMELMVVILIIVVLAALLFPVLGGVREKALRTVCLGNLRHLAMASIQYASENGGQLPFANWGSGDNAWSPGWAYNRPVAFTGNISDLTNGVLWHYIGDARVYRCPMDKGPWNANGPKLSTYIMNGAVCGYSGGMHSYRLSQFSGSDVLFWEADKFRMRAGDDLSQRPNEGLDNRHAPGACVSCFDGHVEWMPLSHFNEMANSTGPRNRLWCRPGM